MKGCGFVSIPQYANSLKKKLCEEICINGKSTIRTAEAYSVPLKTLEKWITAFNKNQYCFDSDDKSDFHFVDSNFNNNTNYNDMSSDELKLQLLKKDIEIARLKKGYIVKEGGTGRKEFVTFSKKNTK